MTITDWKIFQKTRDWYGRFERPISSLSLIGGFIFDAVTLRQVGALWDNIWVVAHLVIVAICIILINRQNFRMGDSRAKRRELAKSEASDPSKLHFWLVNIMQFFFGGILSTYLVFYFRSSALSVNWPFLLILGVAFWANESFKREYIRLSFQIILFYLSLFAFAIFLVPVLLHQIGPWVFVFSGVISLVVMFIFLAILSLLTKRKIREDRKTILLSILGIFIAVNILYFTNLIPPIPLSLKESGVYHSLSKDSAGNYVVTAEPTTWRNFFTLYDDFHITAGQPVYIYSAVFSPPELNLTIVHHYQWYDPVAEKWTDEGNISLYVLGGREGGFRTYSTKSDLFAGKWRVEVQTTSGQTIGTIRFTVVEAAAGALVTDVK